MSDQQSLERLRAVLAGKSYVSGKYGDGVRQQIRYLEGKKVVASP